MNQLENKQVEINSRRGNWRLWAGFLICLLAIASYFFVFFRYPVTRDVPWVTFLGFGVSIALLLLGLKRAFGQPQQYRGKIAGPILSLISLLIIGMFCFLVFYQTRQLPASAGAHRIGQKAPEFTLADTGNRPVSLSSLISTPLENSSTPPRGVVLIFYRGYW